MPLRWAVMTVFMACVLAGQGKQDQAKQGPSGAYQQAARLPARILDFEIIDAGTADDSDNGFGHDNPRFNRPGRMHKHRQLDQWGNENGERRSRLPPSNSEAAKASVSVLDLGPDLSLHEVE